MSSGAHAQKFSAPAQTHKGPALRPAVINLFALPSGGFLLRDPSWQASYVDSHGNRSMLNDAAAFSTLEEALEWLRVNMARPAAERLPA
jgi:hypothetical protein